MKSLKKLFAFFWDKSLPVFLLIGLGNTLITMAGSQLLYGALGYWGASALMFAVTSVVSFVLNRRFSFGSKAPVLRSAVRFAAVIAACYLLSFGLSDWIVPLLLARLVPALGEEGRSRVAMLCAQVVFTGCNYVGQRLWAFRE